MLSYTKQNRYESMKASHPPGRNIGIISSILTVSVLVGVLGHGAYTWYTSQVVAQGISLQQETLRLKEDEIKTLTQKQKVGEKVSAIDIYNRAKAYRIPWSQVVEDVFANQNSKIRFESFSSGRDKNINIAGTAASLEAVAEFLEALKENTQVVDPFISSVREQGNPPTGYQFALTFQYNEQNTPTPSRPVLPPNAPTP